MATLIIGIEIAAGTFCLALAPVPPSVRSSALSHLVANRNGKL
jgi:hypothetical protein